MSKNSGKFRDIDSIMFELKLYFFRILRIFFGFILDFVNDFLKPIIGKKFFKIPEN